MLFNLFPEGKLRLHFLLIRAFIFGYTESKHKLEAFVWFLKGLFMMITADSQLNMLVEQEDIPDNSLFQCKSLPRYSPYT